MKHIKRVKTSVATLLLGENQIHRIPVIALSFVPPKGMVVSSWEEEGSRIVPSYEIVDFSPVSDETTSTLVNLVFQEKVAPEDTALEYMVTIPVHTLVLAQALSMVNESFNMVVLNPVDKKQDDSQVIEIQDVCLSVNFPDHDTETYEDLVDKLSVLIDAQFVEPLHPGYSPESGMNAISAPMRRAQMAIMPILSSLSQNDAKTLLRIIALESTLDNFHLRNHNQSSDFSSGEYSKVIESMEDLENYTAPEIPEDIEYMSTFEYSILDNMTDAMEDHLKINEPQARDRNYYKDVTLLILLTNVKAIYENSETDDFITNCNVVSEESLPEDESPVNRAFMNLVRNELTDTFESIETDKIEKTEMEMEWANDIEKWNKSPDEYWPENMDQVEKALKDSEGAKIYFDIMKRSYSTPEEFRALVSEYGLGKVFTSMILKTGINLSKYTSIVHKVDTNTPSTLVATHWFHQPEDTYLWEFPALSYDLASYDVSTFVTLLKYIKNDFAGYMGVALQGLAVKVLEEGWEKETLEWYLSENTGMPEKYQKIFLDFAGTIDDMEINTQEIDLSKVESKEELDQYLGTKGVQEFVSTQAISIEDIAYMVAYAFPALADIYVQTLAPVPTEDGEEKKIVMGSTEWKKYRVNYIESMLGSIVDNVERNVI
jgi:hypothetical protein